MEKKVENADDVDRFERTLPFVREKVKFKLGSMSEECVVLMHDSNNQVRDLASIGGLPRPSMASLGYPVDQELAKNQAGWEKILHQSRSNTIDKYPVFVELFDLQASDTPGSSQWEETARWIKYEEDVEGVDHHWGRPHVAFLTFHSLIQLRHCFSKGLLLLDLKASNYDAIRRRIAEEMKKRFNIDDCRSNAVLQSLGKNHKHIAENYSFFKSRTYSALPDQIACASSRRRSSKLSLHLKSMDAMNSDESDSSHHASSGASAFRRISSQLSSFKISVRNLPPSDQETGRKATMHVPIPTDSECVQIFVGTIEELQKVRFAMVRLESALKLPELLDAPMLIRFIFVILGPNLADVDYHEIGRSLATLMTNDSFKEIAYKASIASDFLTAIDSFVDKSVVIPPTDLDHKSLITPEDIRKALRRRKQKKRSEVSNDLPTGLLLQTVDTKVVMNRKINVKTVPSKQSPNLDSVFEIIKRKRDPLEKTGRLFGGMMDDLKFRYCHYKDDILDAFSYQCLASLFFMFFAAVAPAISFGGLMGDKTKGQIGTSETLLAQSICGILWSLLACQPLLIMAATGPVVIFEANVYKFCLDNKLDFLPMRFWCSVWLMVICLICVALEGSRMVRYVTRFTEDVFATLIPLIFVFESLKFVLDNFSEHPLLSPNQHCNFSNASLVMNTTNKHPHSTKGSIKQGDKVLNKTSYQNSVDSSVQNRIINQPDTALLSTALLFTTFILAFQLRQLRNSHLFSRRIRRTIGDFGVPISIFVVVMTYVLWFNGPYVERLNIPASFSTTIPDRGWLINPLGIKRALPVWAIFGASLPALFVFILLFVELEITQSLLTMKERGLKRGAGFHFDLALLGFCNVVCSLLGLPWMCAAAVQSLAHCSSLTVTKSHAPGERPRVDHVIEQRVTTLGVALLTGGCTLLGFILQSIPVAVLFGIFLYLGIVSMLNVQFLHRLALMFVPQKYYPDYSYCQQVSMWRMNYYTALQATCLLILWICKSVKYLSLAFPFVLMLIAVFRKFVVPRIFTAKELDALDGSPTDEEERESDEDFYSTTGLPV